MPSDNDIIVKNLTLEDMPLINEFIARHKTMYGVPIDHSVFDSRYRYSITNYHSVGAYINDKCVGICTQYYWERMPAWTMSNLFLDNSRSLFLGDHMIKIIGALTEQCIRNAEKLSMYEFYYLLRDNEKFNRKTQTKDVISSSNEYVSSRYDFVNIHLLKSTDDVKWKYISNMLGDIGTRAISPPYNKTLLVRRATIKQEFRLI